MRCAKGATGRHLSTLLRKDSRAHFSITSLAALPTSIATLPTSTTFEEPGYIAREHVPKGYIRFSQCDVPDVPDVFTFNQVVSRTFQQVTAPEGVSILVRREEQNSNSVYLQSVIEVILNICKSHEYLGRRLQRE